MFLKPIQIRVDEKNGEKMYDNGESDFKNYDSGQVVRSNMFPTQDKFLSTLIKIVKEESGRKSKIVT